MAKPFLTDETKDALIESVCAVEDRSAAEVVIAVRPRAGSPLHVAVIVGAAVAFAAQAYLLFADATFALIWILVDPFVAGLVTGAIAYRIPVLYRVLTPRSVRSRWVRRAAETAFYEKGVRLTRDRTGILVYVALWDRAACLVADRGVTDAVDLAAWAKRAGAIDGAVAAGKDGAAVAAEIAAIGELLEPLLPRREDDANELPDTVCA